jgi:hypothetical protein
VFRSRDEAKGDFGGLVELFRQIPVRAWERYHDKQRAERADFNLGAQATVLHRYMVAAARELLSSVPGIVLSPVSMQGFFFDLHGKWRFRLHKFNDNLTIQPNNTGIGLDFLAQRGETLGLGLGELTNVVLGYRLNSAGSGMASAHIVCPKNAEEFEWEMILLPPDEPGPIPFHPVQPEGPRPVPRVRPSETPIELPRTGEPGA